MRGAMAQVGRVGASPAGARASSPRAALRWIVLAAVLCGAVLRLVCPSTFCYLGDEKWTFEHVRDTLHGGTWPALGMASSRGIKNAPMSVWVFVVLAAAGQVAT